MKTAFCIATAFLLPSGNVVGQEPSLAVAGDTVAVALAGFEWFTSPEWMSLGGGIKTLAVSNVTNGWRADTPGSARGAAPAMSPPRPLGFTEGAIRRLELRATIKVGVCNTIDSADNSLCGLPGPWLWLIPDMPSVVDDRARITVTAVWLEWPPLHDGPGERAYADFDLELVRDRGNWRVVSSRKTGVS
jgi:hypothetical protein